MENVPLAHPESTPVLETIKGVMQQTGLHRDNKYSVSSILFLSYFFAVAKL